jgi:hypothetical protein
MIDNYYLDKWESQFGAKAVKELASEDQSADYEMNAFHVFELENGRYATVYESGCSCYCSEDAQIDVYDSEDEAMSQFNNWKGRGY